MRNRIGVLLILLVPSVTMAQSDLARPIPAAQNPRFLLGFLERFSDGFRARTRFQPEMPESLRPVWRDNMSEARDFAEEILPGVRWPRFQWGIEATPPNVIRPVYQWFDSKNPDRLATEWNRAFCFDSEKNYIGVSWTGDQSRFEFFYREGNRLRVRRYEQKKFTREYFISFKSENSRQIADATLGYTITPVDRVSPRLSIPQAAHLQFSVQREFLISARNFVRAHGGEWELVFFP